MTRWLIALAAFALPCAAAAQQLTAQELTAIDTAVNESLKESGAPSASVAVVRGGQLVLSRAWGKPSETLAEPDPGLPYQIASNSKQFLAALLLILENEGKLDLDDPVVKWLPEIPHADRYTVRQLLSHTSGLQDYWPQDYLFTAMEHAAAPMDIVRRWGMKPLDYEPGTRWQYSNTGYVVAGIIAEKAGGKPLWQQFEERIFVPLGIHPHPVDATNGPAFPQGYHRYALGPVRPARPPAPGWLWAAGELSMTAAELAEWNIARIERSLLPREDWEEMERPVRLADGTTTAYGLGVASRTADGRRIVDHGGASVGFFSQNSVWVDDGLAITVLTNGDFGNAEDAITAKLAQILVPPSAQAETGEAPRTDAAQATLMELVAGTFTPARFTENAQFYFTAEVRSDYSQSLSELGPLTKFEPTRTPRLRGGFVNRVFRATFEKRSLVVSTYAEPGAEGRWEQFIVMP
jgi:CubicO group peptidase (beta-lactamase class C family)